MKIACISDTHGKHHQIPLNWLENKNNEIDIILHAGDISNMGHLHEIEDFCKWYDKLNFANKIFCGGNHDWGFSKKPKEVAEILSNYPSITYLQDDFIVIDGVKIYGSPWQPEFYSWAFNLKRGKELQDKWNMIPLDTDILCMHTPVYGLVDMTPKGEFVGCEDLLNTIVTKLDNVLLTVSGHIHHSYGFVYKYGKTFVNASTVNERYMVANKPILIEFNKETREARVFQ